MFYLLFFDYLENGFHRVERNNASDWYCRISKLLSTAQRIEIENKLETIRIQLDVVFICLKSKCLFLFKKFNVQILFKKIIDKKKIIDSSPLKK